MSFSDTYLSELIETSDGSLSIRDALTGELYHNSAGAFTEALTHYSQPSGLVSTLQTRKSIRILDVCFGLGYNTWVLLDALIKSVSNEPEVFTIHVDCIEQDKNMAQFWQTILSQPMLSSLKQIKEALEHNIYYQTLESADYLEITTSVGNIRCTLKFWFEDFRKRLQVVSQPMDAVFHDPFSPAKVPQLWTVDIFKEYARLLASKNGCLLTYSSAIAVRGGLREAGFTVYRTQPLGKKQGGTVGMFLPLEKTSVGDIRYLYPLRPEEEERLQSRSKTPYRDVTFQATAIEVKHQREQQLKV
jgi:tRNA U34 5-methylaminomethyl-2-thiouridine-forming methyltransferase MnmC